MSSEISFDDIRKLIRRLEITEPREISSVIAKIEEFLEQEEAEIDRNDARHLDELIRELHDLKRVTEKVKRIRDRI